MSSTGESNSDNYTTVKLPKELMEEIDDIIRCGFRGYKSSSEFTRESIRKRLDEIQAQDKIRK